ncbi:hypothetical protein [Microbispora sp. CA-102843]|uniref:hypothetical protein n=1 Tax=Microbispora sp. CA-102843 TaxID=3239952 RepID=UPI003D8A1382
MQFSQPSAGSDWRAADYVGHLILFYPREYREGIVTSNGTSDAIQVDLVVLTHPEGPKPEENVLLFQKVLRSSLRANIGKDPVLARLGQGTPKPGQSAAYILNPFNEQDAAYATQYLQSVGGNPFGSTNFGGAAQQQTQNVPLPQAAHAPAPVAAAPVAPAPVAPAPVAPAAAYPQPAAAPHAVPAMPAPVPQAALAVPAVPSGGMVTLPNGQTVTPEVAAAMQQLGMTVPPAAPPAA